MADPKLAVQITADDKSAKGVASADKRFSKLAKNAGKVGKDTSGPKRFSEQVASMERATARLFGVKPLSSSLGERFGGLQKIVGSFSETRGGGAIAAAEGGEAAGLGGAAEAASSGVAELGGAALGAAGAVVGLAVGAIAMEAAWSNSAAALGRLSAATGMAARDIDALASVGERAGVSREQTQGSIGALGKMLNDAQYGRNNTALALENQLGISAKRDANGAPDVKAFLLDLSKAIAAQKNPYTQQEIASRFGVEALLPVLRQGAITDKMAWAYQHATSRDNQDTDRGQANLDKQVSVKQEGERVLNATGAEGAEKYGQALDLALKGGTAAHNAIVNAGGAIARAADGVGHALEGGAHVVEHGFANVGKAFGEAARKFVEAAVAGGADARIALTTAAIETGRTFNPHSQSKLSSAHGMVQILQTHVSDYGISAADRDDPAKSGEAYARKDAQNIHFLQQHLKRAITPWEHYLAWQQGATGALKTLRGDQNRRAVDVLGEAEVSKNVPKGTNWRQMTLHDFEAIWERQYQHNQDWVGRKLAATGPGGNDLGDGGTDSSAQAPPDGQPAKAEVTIRLAGAPQGTVTSVSGAPGVNVKVERAMAPS